MKIIIANNAAALKAVNPSHTVEAEYGLEVVEGSNVTLAHHGPRADNPCPCLGDNINECPYNEDAQGCAEFVEKGLCHQECLDSKSIGISHFDLDTLGGAMRCMGVKEYDPEEGESMFWRVAALVDIMGIHKLEGIKKQLWEDAMGNLHMGTSEFNTQDYFFQCRWDDCLNSLNGFWAWSEANRLFPPRDGSVQDVTGFFKEAIRVVILLEEGDWSNQEYKDLHQAGETWMAAKETLNKESLRDVFGGTHKVGIRVADQFVNHLYTTPQGDPLAGVVGYNPKTGAVTLSLADPVEGVSCCGVAQQLWGPEAGGHAGIAGSPRGRRLDIAQAHCAGVALSSALGWANE